ncbi:hypothetical protein BDN67DRAFT_1066863, partial [Paxillus ammoniavirescens]
MIHAFFYFACRDLDRLAMTFAPLSIDLIRCVDEEWGAFLTYIKNGTIPDLEDISRVRAH